MEEDYEYYLKEQAFLSAEIEYEEGELLREMYQKEAKVVLLTEIPDIQHDRVKIEWLPI